MSEDLDWLTSTIEPYVWSVADNILKKTKNEYDITKKIILEKIDKYNKHSTSFSFGYCYIEIQDFEDNLDSKEMEIIKTISTMETTVEDFFEDDPDDTIVAKFKIDKSKLLNDDLFDIFKSHCVEDAMVDYHFLRFEKENCDEPTKERIQFVAEILNVPPTKIKRKGIVNKQEAIRKHLRFLIYKNEWNIRNLDLYLKFIEWIRDYTLHDSNRCLVNILKLKEAYRRNETIYSIEEED